MKKSYYFYTTFGLLILLGLIISGYIFGWTVPSTTPPGGNVAPPINTGSTNQAKTGYLAVGTSTTPTYPLEVGNQLRVWGQLISKVASGTAPFVVDSPTKVTNLNADLLDGYDSSDLLGGGTVWGFSAPPGNCPPYDDCDGDGHTAFTGDCDETCPTCYVGSTAYTTSPDGKDQDCDGIIDEATPVCTPSYGSQVTFGYNGSSCGWVSSGSYAYTDSTASAPSDTSHCTPTGSGCTAYSGGWGNCTRQTTTLYADSFIPNVTCAGKVWYGGYTNTGTLLYYYKCQPMTGCTTSYKYF